METPSKASKTKAAKKKAGKRKTARNKTAARKSLAPSRVKRGLEASEVGISIEDPAVIGLAEEIRSAGGAALAAYREGGIGLLSLIDAQRTQNEVALLFAQASRDYALGWLDLERAVGSDELSQTAEPSRTAALH